MYPVSAAFLAAIPYPSSYARAVRADVYTGNSLLTPNGLTVVDGKVTVDSTANVWRSASLSVVDPTGTLAALVTPYGSELRISSGLALPGGNEMVPLGVFPIGQSVISDSGNSRLVTVTAYDRSWIISRSRLSAPYSIPAGTNYVSAMSAFVHFVYPGCPISFPTTTGTTPALAFLEEDDPWQKLTSMATDMGNLLYFDVSGTLVMKPQPNATQDAAVIAYGDGYPSILGSLSVVRSADPGYNQYIVESTAPGISVRSVAQDLDSTSPTYVLGPYNNGIPVSEFAKSEFITTQAQANAAALAGLLVNKGATQIVSGEMAVNPAHEGLDVVRLNRSSEGIANQVYLLERFDIPLKPGDRMPFSMRKRQAT